jgi:hypothetical protein
VGYCEKTKLGCGEKKNADCGETGGYRDCFDFVVLVIEKGERHGDCSARSVAVLLFWRKMVLLFWKKHDVSWSFVLPHVHVHAWKRIVVAFYS